MSPDRLDTLIRSSLTLPPAADPSTPSNQCRAPTADELRNIMQAAQAEGLSVDALDARITAIAGDSGLTAFNQGAQALRPLTVQGASLGGGAASVAPRPVSSTVSTASAGLDDAARRQIAIAGATCPFMGAAVATKKLDVLNNADNPLASIEQVRALGNLGGGDLGDLLSVFATGNQTRMPGASGALTQPTPLRFLSLIFGGSQGAHPGHSGTLLGDPTKTDSGRIDLDAFSRMTANAQGGMVKRSDIGRFIAANLHKDPNSKAFGKNAAELLGGDLLRFSEAVGPDALLALDAGDQVASRDLQQKLTKLTGEDNLIGSCGEFGLLFAFFANKKPGNPTVDGEPTLAVDDLRMMFIDKTLPPGWEQWKKTTTSWVENTTALVVAAGKAYKASS